MTTYQKDIYLNHVPLKNTDDPKTGSRNECWDLNLRHINNIMCTARIVFKMCVTWKITKQKLYAMKEIKFSKIGNNTEVESCLVKFLLIANCCNS